MQEALSADLFKSYLITRVDFCVVSTANYLPIIAYEVDSPFHEASKQKERDEKKNKIYVYRSYYSEMIHLIITLIELFFCRLIILK